MTQNKLQINRPSLTSTWTKAQMEAAAVRIHQRFQGLLVSIIESADWANYRLTKNPIEAGRPAFPEPGEYCDLILQKRNGEAVVALEVKTKHAKIDDRRPIWSILDEVLDRMGPKLTKLQTIAHEGDALWVVALGIYRAPFQAAAVNYSTPWEVVMVWGRDVGRDSPMSRARWHSLNDLDKAICDFTDPQLFWSVASLPRKSPSSPNVTQDLEELIAHSKLPHECKLALLAVMSFPEEEIGIRTYMKRYATAEVSAYKLQHWALLMAEAGVIRGYKKGRRSHQLTIDEPTLRAYLKDM